jgi:hypothetical protein
VHLTPGKCGLHVMIEARNCTRFYPQKGAQRISRMTLDRDTELDQVSIPHISANSTLGSRKVHLSTLEKEGYLMFPVVH